MYANWYPLDGHLLPDLQNSNYSSCSHADSYAPGNLPTYTLAFAALQAEVDSAQMTSSESVRARFTGNTCLYVFAARYRPPVFLKRNIDAVLRKCESEEMRRTGGEMVTPVSGNSTPVGDRWPRSIAIGGAPPPTRRAETLSQIIARLRPPIPTGGKNEPVLRIEAKSLKRKRLYKPRLDNLGSSGNIPQSIDTLGCIVHNGTDIVAVRRWLVEYPSHK
jgi:hypothetical protein